MTEDHDVAAAVADAHRREWAFVLALILLTDARRAARTGELGGLVLLEHQDRRLWHAGAIAEGVTVLHEALRLRPRGRFCVAAARADVLRRVGRGDEPAMACSEALALTANTAEQTYLAGRLRELGAG